MMKKVLDTIEELSVSLDGRHIIVGLSGGSDSMTLLDILMRLRDEKRFTLTAAHVNHGIRGEEAQRDEAFVQSYCIGHDVPIRILHADIPATAKQTGESSEECGRRIRYEFFRSIDPDALIATAHNLNDCAETFFLNLTRGTGLKGLIGIPPVRGNIIRPLIRCTKEEIESYCTQNQIPFVIDRTNFSNAYNRNKLRNIVLPVLQQINPSFLDCFARSMAILKTDEDFLEQETAEYIRSAKQGEAYSVAALLSAPPTLLGRMVFEALKELSGTTPEARHVNAVVSMLKSGGSENLNGGKTAVSDGRYLFIRSTEKPEPMQPVTLYTLPDHMIFGDREILFSVGSPHMQNSETQESFQCSLNYDGIRYPVTVRTKKDGDRFHPAGRGVGKTLKKLFCEQHLSAAERAKTVILTDANGILCVEGFGIDERAAVASEQNTALYITIRRVSNETRH